VFAPGPLFLIASMNKVKVYSSSASSSVNMI